VSYEFLLLVTCDCVFVCLFSVVQELLYHMLILTNGSPTAKELLLVIRFLIILAIEVQSTTHTAMLHLIFTLVSMPLVIKYHIYIDFVNIF